MLLGNNGYCLYLSSRLGAVIMMALSFLLLDEETSS